MNERRLERDQRGFTLIELLMVVAIIGILAAMAAVNFRGAMDRSKQTKTMTTMRNLGTALHAYEMDFSMLPADGTSGTALQNVLAPGTFTTIEVRDAWRTNIEYHTSAAHYTIRSYGSDGILGPADITRATRDVYANDIVMADGMFTNSPQY